MSKRYYISKIVGDGTDGNEFRPRVADYGVSWVGSIPTGEDGRPLYDSCLCIVNTDDHSVLRRDVDIDALPDFPLDGKLSAIQTGTKNAMLAALAARGYDTTSLGNADGYRDVLQSIGLQRDPNFNLDRFDIR